MKTVKTTIELRMEIRKEIQKKQAAGNTYREIAKELQLPMSTIYRILKREEQTTKFQSRRASAIKLESCTRIARRLGIQYCITNIPEHSRGF